MSHDLGTDIQASRPIRPSQCILCSGSAKRRALFELSRPILQCGSCGLVYAEPHRVGTSPHDYAEYYYRGGVYADYLKDRHAIHRNAMPKLALLERLTPGRNLLDVGCATGVFLEAAQARGWAVQGLEILEYASDCARRESGLSTYRLDHVSAG
jgi:hypothetical protein